MSLGTCALKVGWGPEHLRLSKVVSMATLCAGTTPGCSNQLAPSHLRNSVKNTHLTQYLPMYTPKRVLGGRGRGQRYALKQEQHLICNDQL